MQILKPHNLKTYNNLVGLLQSNNKAAIVQPTGSGKSYIVYQLALDNPDKRIIMFVPNISIKNIMLQSMNEYGIKNIEIITYQLLIRLNKIRLKNLKADYIIFDEMHRIKATEWSKSVNKLFRIHKQAKFIGMTATPKRCDGSNVLEGFGKLACNMTLGDAIINSILPTPTYISAIYDISKEYQKVESNIRYYYDSCYSPDLLKELEAVKKDIEEKNNIPEILKRYIPNKSGKYIVFCKNINHLKTMKDTVCGWFTTAGFQVTPYYMYSGNNENSKAFKMFSDSESCDCIDLLFSVNMLNEGVHVKGVDGVILLRPTISKIVYTQQIGRAIDAANNNNPVIFDFVNNFSAVGSKNLKAEIETAVENNPDTQFNIDDFKIYDYISDSIDAMKKIDKKIIRIRSYSLDPYRYWC